jgi:hypothetical protein
VRGTSRAILVAVDRNVRQTNHVAIDEFRVIIPEERGSIVTFKHDGLPGVGVINNLRQFEPKAVFAWHLSLTLRCVGLADQGMPTREEYLVLDEFGDKLDIIFKGSQPEKPNALFLGRITWNATRELIYRVYDPKPIDAELKRITTSKAYPREFDYRIAPDKEWKLAKWCLDTVKDA